MFKHFYFICLVCYLYSDLITAKSLKGLSAESYGQPCNEDDDCIDFRLICHDRNRRCTCTRFYDWSNETRECKLNTNTLTLWLGDQSKDFDPEDFTGKNSHTLFYIQSIAGILAIITLSVISLVICSLAFCVQDDEEIQCIIEDDEKCIDTPTTSA